MKLADAVHAHKPRIVLAAINHGGKVWTGRRHAQIMNEIWDAEGFSKIRQEEQGFVTDDGIFVNRFEAGAIAFRAGQIGRRKENLLSEDLW